MDERLIFHVDVNSAFLSWEATRRVKNGEPDLRLIPSCIGGDPESRRGVVLAKSIPAKAFKIRTGEPIAMALRKCPQLVIAKPDFKLYSACSKAFKDICRGYAPVVEEFSIDECFMDMTGTGHMYPDPIALSHTIKDRIRDELGFTVNIGIGRNKLCAKMASDFEKPDKIHTLYPEEIPDKLWPLPVGDLLFVGGTSANRLREEHICTIGELAHADPELLRRILGDKMSIQARNYANGIDNSPVRAEPEEAKGYSNSVTLEENVTTLEAADAILLALSDSVSAHMRSDGAKAYCVAVSIRYHYYPTLDDLLSEMQMEMSAAYIELVKDYKLPEVAEKVNRIFFEYSAAQGLAYEKITCSSGSYSATQQSMYRRVMVATWGKSTAFQKLSREEQNLVLSFINSFGVSCYRQWVADGKRMPLEEVIQLSGTLMCGGLDKFFKEANHG